MIETEQTVTIDAGIGAVWEHVSDIRRWATLMPGFRGCDLIDADRSRWTLKIGVGALVRTVTVDVYVARWEGPEQVDFAYKLDGDPVEGTGTYRAVAIGPDAAEITLAVQVEGSGKLAPMWEAMGRPLLPKFASGFAKQLKAAIEQPAVAETEMLP